MELTLKVPEPFAFLLLDNGAADLPLADRSGGSAVQAVIEVTSMLADTTAIVVALAAFPEIARRLLAWARHSEPGEEPGQSPARIKITTAGGAVVQVILPRDGDAAGIEIAVDEMTVAVRPAIDSLPAT